MTIYTIGHSTHEFEWFLELLQHYGINCVVDVRSVPFSAYTPQFNQDNLKPALSRHNITYLHFAKEFGARQTDPNLLDEDGVLDFEKMRQSEPFKQGVDRIQAGCEKGFTIAIMCSEDDPLKCHRFAMIAIGLEEAGCEVLHILKDKSTKTNAELKKMLLGERKKNSTAEQPVLFEDFVTDIALKAKNKKIGYASNFNTS